MCATTKPGGLSVPVRVGLIGALMSVTLVGGCTNRTDARTAASSTTEQKATPATAVVSNLNVGIFPSRMAIDPDAHKLYVAGMGEPTVLDTTTRNKVGAIALGGGSYILDGIAIDRSGQKLYLAGVSGTDGNVLVVDLASGRVTGTIAVGDSPGGLLLGPDEKTLYVQYSGENTLKTIDVVSEKVTGAVELSESVEAMALSPVNHTIYAAGNGSSDLLVIDTAANKVSDTVKLPDQADDVAVDPKSGTVIAVGYNGHVMSVDPTTRAVVDSTPLGAVSSDRSLSVDPAAHAIYVTTKEQKTVSVIDADTHTLTTTVPLDDEPQHVVADPLTHSVFVTTKSGVTVLSGK
ncbi:MULTISPECIES: YncE family protein [unclassified Mycolicibacterium]|uniref:YncE family protein n=1 Tax=unclassified Mycolicibacterium TaxID=2636767 RepID=UPI002ED97D13